MKHTILDTINTGNVQILCTEDRGIDESCRNRRYTESIEVRRICGKICGGNGICGKTRRCQIVTYIHCTEITQSQCRTIRSTIDICEGYIICTYRLRIQYRTHCKGAKGTNCAEKIGRDILEPINRRNIERLCTNTCSNHLTTNIYGTNG